MEAVANLTEPLELLRTRTENRERDRAEIGLMVDLAMCTGMRTWEGLDSSLEIAERALRLSEKIGDDPNHPKILEFLILGYGVRPNH